MKRCKKTYAIHNLAEKHTIFHLGKTKVHVSFTGGQVTKNGVNPATFTTTDPIVQLAIERSNDFLKGAITLQAQYMMPGEVKIGRNACQRKPLIPAEPEDEDSAPDCSVADTILPSEESDIASEEAPVSSEGLEVIEASCKDVAKQYLQEHFGENPAKLRTRDDVQKCAEKYGLTFNFI